jgi:caffeoyl-CoA O-methyltransferase
MYREEPAQKKSPADPAAGIYCFMDKVAKDAERYAAAHTSPMSPLLEEIERFTLNKTSRPSMLTGRVEGRFLQMIVQLSGARRIVDIGTFTGYSALAMAEVLPDDGEIITLERDPAHADIAREFFSRSPHESKIRLCIGEALEIMKSLPAKKTDIVFIDADKQSYTAYYEEAIRIVKKGGLILADNTFWYGTVLAPDDEESRAMAAFNDMVNADPRAEKVFLSIRDGIYLIRKK